MNKCPRPVVWGAWVVIAWGLKEAEPFLIPLLLAALLAFLMNPLVSYLEKRKIPEWLAVTFSSILMFLPVLALGSLMLHEGAILIRDYPIIINSVKTQLEQFAGSAFAQRFNLTSFLDLTSLTQRFIEDAGKTVSAVLVGLKAVAEASAHFFIILFFSIIMLASRQSLRKSAGKLMSHPKTLNDIVTLIEKFLITRIGIAAAVALVDIVILKAFGSRYSIIFGAILGFSTFIPAIGFFLAIVPPLIAAFAFQNPPLMTGIMMGLLYVVSSIEGHFVTPKYLGRQLNLNLFVTFLGLFAGDLLWGIWGMVLSIPLLGILRIILAATPEYRAWSEAMAERTEAELLKK
jgi:predicted PurR-regulated permease PerM